ncbi:MAG: hypothetical protein HRT44_08555 [Bdellovibrionales bacterium]|nr:hypothetical protein [Bdellovibrionales bacterium]NQZ19291.1 hypothetical protein [Bdellovibrionales bacterium]
MNKCAIFTFVLIYSLSLFGKSCPASKSNLFFGNGMFTTLDSAKETIERLRLHGPKHDSYSISYNKNENALEQILEVASQKVASEKISESTMIALLLKGEIKDSIRKLFANEFSSILSRNLVEDEDLNAHIEVYSQLIEKGGRVHVLSHSQCNFYANEAYDLLEKNLEIRSTHSR